MSLFTHRAFLTGAVTAIALSLGIQAITRAAHAETELLVVPHADPKILDPIWTTAYISRNHGYMIYDTLFSLDANGEIQPQMVDTVTRSEDGKTVTLTLREGLMWHDNTPVTAHDCVVSIQRWGGKDAMGQKLMSFVENLSADGDMNIVFEMSIPTGLVELALSKPSSNVPFMMPARVAETPGDEQITEYIGSGPYVFNEEEWQPGTRVVYEKFDGYVPRTEAPSGLAGGKVAKVDRVIWTPIRDIQQAVNSLNAGELDIIESVPADVIPLVEDAGAAYIKDPNPPGLQYTARYNVLHPPFDNAKVRQALLYAFNQEDFLEATVGNPDYYTVCKALFGCGLPFETDAHMEGLLESNFAKARELLEEGGYNGEEVLLMHSTNVPVLTNLAPVAKDLMEAIGMNVKMESMDWSTLVARRSKKDAPADGGWNMFITAWTMGDLINPLTAAFLNSSCESALFGWPCSEEIEKLRDDFARAGSHEEQMAAVVALQAAWREYPTHIHLGQWASPSALAKNVDGYLQGGVPVFWNISK
ncbi:MAG: ABC transporter substrate-binding protein [Roseovarius sp.]|nr:ABC transporter substrate-binding protein [Roseovarius sp.]MCY4208521.1 ABC transporter substrate-binding protein [Roseovarius sp.]MCY4293125.1 ABC transporter substrate-binding protein [Roseovarius sp.]MCY4317014.1 ABC transporter substrate-binding protein [Roseovarius sp.]